MKTSKPLNGRAYGSIGHLPDSKLGPGDHSLPEGQGRILTVKTRDRHDEVIVTEKVDGSCTAVAKIDGSIKALTRSGYLAHTSKFPFLRKFDRWVSLHQKRFDALLENGEHIAGEWMIQAHGILYDLPHMPWIAFDLLRGKTKASYEEFRGRVWEPGLFPTPRLIHQGSAIPVKDAMPEKSGHGSIQPPEGMVYRVERQGKVDFLGKFVRHDFEPGKYLPELSGDIVIWNNWTDDIFDKNLRNS